MLHIGELYYGRTHRRQQGATKVDTNTKLTAIIRSMGRKTDHSKNTFDSIINPFSCKSSLINIRIVNIIMKDDIMAKT